jgi:glycosyltransferase involved in cell wall biosynthesis
MNRRFSIATVICTSSDERKELLHACLESVLAGTRLPEEIFVVVDQNPLLGAELAKSLPASVTLLRTEQPGLSEARTVGLRAATSDLVAFVDDDATVERDWLASLVQPLETTDRVLGVGGAIVPRWESDGPWLPEELLWLVGCTYRGHRRDPGPIRNPIGANMAFRRQELVGIGGFDPQFGKRENLYCDETELSLRLERAHGPRRIRYAPTARAYHFIPSGRLSLRALFVRCILEGLSKGRLHRLYGLSSLTSERGYARGLLGEAMPRLMLSALRDRNVRALKGAGAIVVALVLTGGAFIVGRAGAGSKGDRAGLTPQPPNS